MIDHHLRTKRRLVVSAGMVLCAAIIVALPKHRVALIQVVDSAGRPVAGAVVLPEGMRIKPGPYSAGWYSWVPERHGIPNLPVTTDADGYASIPYPRYVLEELETGVLCLSVSHPDFVPDRPERTVDTALPAGAPFGERIRQWWNRILQRTWLVRPPPVVLQPGSTLEVTARLDDGLPADARVFVQVSHEPYGIKNFWSYPERNKVFTRQLAAGTHNVRALAVAPDGRAWFSEVVSVNASAGLTNAISLALKPGVAIVGELDRNVPRPVRNGRVVVNITPPGLKLQEKPPRWHAWGSVRPDGTFSIHSLPAGDLEIVAMCNGFVSTNGPGKSRMRYPQRHVISTNDLGVTVGMEPTAVLEVHVTGPNGRPLAGAKVATWPNVRYGEWSATIFMSDRYLTSDVLLNGPDYLKRFNWRANDFVSESDSNGVAVLANLPATVDQLGVEHPKLGLPIVTGNTGQKSRKASFTLTAGQTNRISIQLEPLDESVIRHY